MMERKHRRNQIQYRAMTDVEAALTQAMKTLQTIEIEYKSLDVIMSHL